MNYKSKYLNHNNDIFYTKYIKYKKKYLDLKNSEFFGGNLNSAKIYFNDFLQREKNKEKYVYKNKKKL